MSGQEVNFFCNPMFCSLVQSRGFLPPVYAGEVMFLICLCVCPPVCVPIALQLLNDLTQKHFWYGGTSRPYLGYQINGLHGPFRGYGSDQIFGKKGGVRLLVKLSVRLSIGKPYPSTERHSYLILFLQDLRDKHLWVSIFSVSPYSNFTRLQRLACAFSFIFTAMLTNMMFYGLVPDDNTSGELAGFTFNWGQVTMDTT